MADNFGSAFSDAFSAQQRIGLAERAQQYEQEAARKAEAEKIIQSNLGVAAKITQAAADAGKDPMSIAGAIQPLIESAAHTAETVYGPDGAIRVQRMGQALLARPAAATAQSEGNWKAQVVGEDLNGKSYRMINSKTGEMRDIGGGDVAVPSPPASPSINLSDQNITGVSVDGQPTAAPTQLAMNEPRPPQPAPPTFDSRFNAVNAPAPSQVPVQTPGNPIADQYGNVNNSNNAWVKSAIESGTTDWKQLDAEATRYNMGDNSVVTAYGRSTKGPMAIQRAAVIARGNDLMIAQGMKPGEVAGARAKNKALDKSLSEATSMKTAVDAFSDAESKNLDVLGQLAQKVDSTGVPVFERWIRAGRQATGDPDVAQFNFQFQIVKAGLARIITNPNLKGVLTDDARHEIEGGFPGSSNVKQIMAIIGLAKGDFRRRSDALDSKISDLQSQFRGLGLPLGDARQLTKSGLLSSVKNRGESSGGNAVDWQSYFGK